MNNSTHELSFFAKNQTRLLRLTLGVTCIFTLFVILGAFIYFASLALDLFSPVIWPLVLATILAVLLSPLVRTLENWSGFSRPVVILIIYFLLLLLVFLGLWTIGGEIIQQFQMLIKDSTTWPDRVETKIKNSFKEGTWIFYSQWFDQFKDQWQDALSSLSSQAPQIAQSSGQVIRSAWEGFSSFFGSLACVAVLPVYLFIFLTPEKIISLNFLQN